MDGSNAHAPRNHNHPPELLEAELETEPHPIDMKLLLDPTLLREDLGFDHAGDIERRQVLLDAIDRFEVAHTKTVNGKKLVVIGTEEEQAKAGDFREQIKAFTKQIEADRKARIAPFNEAARTVQEFFLRFMAEPLSAALSRIQDPMNAYAEAKLAAARKAAQEEAARIAAEAATKRRQAEAAAATAAPAVAAAAIQEAEQAEKRATKAAKIAGGSASSLARTRGAMGSVTHVQEVHVYEVTNLAEVPREHLVLSDSSVRERIKAGARGTDIPGILITKQVKTGG